MYLLLFIFSCNIIWSRFLVLLYTHEPAAFFELIFSKINYTFPMSVIKTIKTIKFCSIVKIICSFTMHFWVMPLANIFVSILKAICSLSIYLIILKLSFISIFILEDNFSISIFFEILKISKIYIVTMKCFLYLTDWYIPYPVSFELY